MIYKITLEDLLANAFIEKLKLDDSDRFISYKEIDSYGEMMIKSICDKNENAELYLSRDNTNNVLNKYHDYYEKTENGIILKSEITTDKLMNEFRGYLSLFLMKEYISVYKKMTLEDSMMEHESTKKVDISNWTMEKPTDVNYGELLNIFDLKKKAKVEEILKSKPTKEQIFNSVIIDKSYYEESCKQQIELTKEQEKERNKLKPTSELYNMNFDI